jgi:hypothetical protein
MSDFRVTHAPDDAAVYDLVCPTLIGSKYLLEALELAREHGRSSPEHDAAAIHLIIQQLGDAAAMFHAWYTAKHAPTAVDQEGQ